MVRFSRTRISEESDPIRKKRREKEESDPFQAFLQQKVKEQQHQLPSKKQQNLSKPNGEDQLVVTGGGTSTESAWVISINEKLDFARQENDTCAWSKLSIYSVPHRLRHGDYKAYVPQIVSLGPYHHGNMLLHQMERHKWRSLQQVLKRTNQDIKLYLDCIEKLEEGARACYEGPINMSSNAFVEMMVLDGCFVLELFRCETDGYKQLGYDKNDPVFATRGSMRSIQRDMILLENQIPLFILDKLLELQSGPGRRDHVAKLAVTFLDPLIQAETNLTESDQNKLESSLHCLDVFRRRLSLRKGISGPLDPAAGKLGLELSHSVTETRLMESDQNKLESSLHCLDVFRRCLSLRKGISTPLDPAPHKLGLGVSHSVTELRDSGIKFKEKKPDQFWVTFDNNNGVLEIPKLLIDDDTKSLFLNLMAFEQCHFDCANDICSYVLFMDHLINSSEDVRHLHCCGIIENWLGSDDKVADLFNGLCQEVVFDIDNSYFSELSGKINRYYNKKWHTWRANLKQKYFSNPWAIISVIAGVVLLLLAFAQTFYGVYGYHRPR